MPGICPRCEKNVYFAEEVKGLGNVYHKLCFSCSACRKLLDSGSITEHDNKMFCNSCYRSDSNSQQSGPCNQNISFLGRTLGRRVTDSVEELELYQWMMGMVTSPTPMLWITKPKPILRQRNPLCQAILPQTSKVLTRLFFSKFHNLYQQRTALVTGSPSLRGRSAVE